MTVLTNEQDDQLSEIFKALSDSNRIKIVRLLNKERRELNCGDIGTALNLSKPTVSYHFKILRTAGLTRTRRVAQVKFLSLNSDVFNQFLPGFLDVL